MNREKDEIEADKMKLEHSYRAKIVELEKLLSETSGQLSIFNKEFLQAQEDISSVCIILSNKNAWTTNSDGTLKFLISNFMS